MTLIATLMTRNPVTVDPQDSLQRAAQLMDDLNVGALPVCRSGMLLGIVTDRDIAVRATAVGLDPVSTPVELVMTDRLRCCAAEDTAGDALFHMSHAQIRRLPVIDAQGRLVGIISLGDLAAREPRGVQAALGSISTPSEPDRAAA